MAFGRRVAGLITQREMMLAMPPRSHFIGRTLHNIAIAFGIIGCGLGIGMAGYHWLGKISCLEPFYHSPSILAGKGPPRDPATHTREGQEHRH